MPLTAGSTLQENSGVTTTDTASLTVTLPAGTAAGSTILAVFNQLTAVGGMTLPSGFVLDAATGSSTGVTLGTCAVARKSGTTAGESSWTFTASGSTPWAWWVAEVAGLDLVDPLDASAVAGSTTVALAATANKSTGTTGANSGMDTLQLACFGFDGAATAGGTWTAYSNGYTGEAQVFAAGTGGRGVAVASRLSGGASVGPFESTGTYTANASGPSNVYGMLAAYRAADSPVVNPLAWMAGFEQGTHNGLGSNLLGVTSIATVVGTVGTNVIVQAASARSAPSAYGCRLVASAAAVYVGASTLHFPVTAKAAAFGMNVRVVSGSGIVVAAEIQPGGTILQLVYDVTNTRFGLRWGASGTVAWQAGTTALGAWAWVDLGVAFGPATTWHADWQLETGGVMTAQTSPTDLTGQTATTLGGVRAGSNTAQTSTIDVDDIALSIFRGAFPLGPHVMQALTADPTATPTVSGTVGNFALVTNNATGATLTAGTLTAARDAIDERPPTISTASDGVVQATAAATDYLQFPLTSFTVGSAQVIAAARLLAALISTTGSGAGNLGIRGWDGTTEASLVAASGVTPGSSTTVSNTIPPWATAMWNPSGGWTQTKLHAASLRLGFSSDATPDMGVHAMYAEVATRPAIRASQMRAESDLFTADLLLNPYTSASVSYEITSGDATRGVTFSYSVLGVTQSPVYVPPNSSTVITVQADGFGDVSDLALTPDAAT